MLSDDLELMKSRLRAVFRMKSVPLSRKTSPPATGFGEVYLVVDAQTLAMQQDPPVLKPELLATGAQVGAATYHGASSPPWLEVQRLTSSQATSD